MAGIVWDEIGSRVYETGVDRGVLYLPSGNAVPWNGLLEVTEKPNTEATSVYYDGMKISELADRGAFIGAIKAITYPDEFSEVEGLGVITNGVYLGEQNPQVFNLAYRTRIGDDLSDEAGYKLHILYNVTAIANDKTYATITDDPNIAQFAWDISAIPEEVEGYRPSAHIILDSRTINEAQLQEYEDILYGTAETDASLIPMIDFVNSLYYGYKWKIIDNGDGTWTAINPTNDLIDFGVDPDEFTLNEIDATYLTDVLYEIQDTLV